MKKIILSALMLMLFSFNVSANVNTPQSATDFVLHALNVEIQGLVNANVSEEERLKAFSPFVLKNIDIQYLVRFSLGRKRWKQATDDEKTRAIFLMRERIAKLYINNFEKIKNGQVSIQGKPVTRNGTTTVKTKIVLADGGSFKVTFMIKKENELFKIKDIIVEGVRISYVVKNHFRRNVKKDGIVGLIKRLEAEA